MNINANRPFTLIAAGLLICCCFSMPAFSQSVTPPQETTKSLPAKLVIYPVLMEFYEAPVNARLIEANLKEYTPGDTTPKANYNIHIQTDTDGHSLTEIATPVGSQGNDATKKIYRYNDPAKIQSLEYYKGDGNNWVLAQTQLYTYPGMYGSRSLLMRKTRIVNGKDTTAVNNPEEENFIYDSHMRLIQSTSNGQSHIYKYNEYSSLASEKITGTGTDWHLTEYVYTYPDDGYYWIKKDEFETTPNQPRYLKSSTTRTITFK